MAKYVRKKGILDEINEYYDRANRRDTANTLKMIQLNQEIEAARKSGNKAAENRLLQEKSIVQKSVNVGKTFDGIYLIFVLFVIFMIILFFVWIFNN